MDRHDERKHGHSGDERHDLDRQHDHRVDDRLDREHPAREGDVLGLGGSAVPKQPGDPSASTDPDAAARRRARMREGEAEDAARRNTDTADNFGSASVDMGAGGKGNTIDRG
jgi:hypothetical protein